MRFKLEDSIDEQERITMRQQRENPVNVEIDFVDAHGISAQVVDCAAMSVGTGSGGCAPRTAVQQSDSSIAEFSRSSGTLPPVVDCPKSLPVRSPHTYSPMGLYFISDSYFSSQKDRSRRIFASRGVKVASASLTASRMLACKAASAGKMAAASSTRSPMDVSSFSPTGASREIGSLTICSMARILASGISIRPASAAASGSCPVSCNISRETRLSLLMVSIIWTGIRMVRAWSATDRLTACLIHQVAYVENLYPRRYSNLSTARIRPILPSCIR